MRPLTLQMTDFNKFHDATLDLSDITLAAIVGENGAGKSTILVAIAVALFGAKATTSLDRRVRRGASGFRVELEFVVEGTHYRVVREHGKAQKAMLLTYSVDARGYHSSSKPVCEPKVTDVDAAIIGILGCDYAGFSLAHHLPQGALGAFAKMPPADRKAWLMANLPMRQWSSLESAAKAAAGALGIEITRAEARLEAAWDSGADRDFDGEALTLAAELTQKVAALDATERIQDKGAAAREERARLMADLRGAEGGRLMSASSVRAAEATVVDADLALHNHITEIQRLEALVTSSDFDASTVYDLDAIATRRDFYTEAARLFGLTTQTATAAVAEATRLADFRGQSSPVCPLCHQHTGDEARAAVEQDILKHLAEAEGIAETEKRLLDAHMATGAALKAEPPTDAAQARGAMLAASDALAGAKAHEAQRAAVADSISRLDTLREQTDGLASAVASAKARRAEAVDMGGLAEETYRAAAIAVSNAPADESADAVESLRALRACVSDIERRTERLAADREASDKARAEAERLTDGLVGLRHRADLLTLLAKAYGKSGIPARMIEGATEQIETFANDFLGRFSDGMSIALTTQRENKTDKSVRETLDILVSDADGTQAIEECSGGEQTRVNFALAVGLSRFLSTLGAGHIESFVVDEPTFLDTAGLGELIKCLHILGESVPLVLLVTHEQACVDAFPQKVVVSRGPRGSVAEVVTQ